MFDLKKIDLKKVLYVGSLVVAAVTAVCEVVSKTNQEEKIAKMEKAIETLTGKKL